MTDFTITEDFPRSEIEFDQRFSNPDACYQHLFQIRWPDGFVCKKCGHKRYWLSSRNLYIFTQCEHQHSLSAGTIMDNSKSPIAYWFKAMWWFTIRKSGIKAVNMKELLGFGSYETAWTWLQKLRRCTIRQERDSFTAVLRSMSFLSVDIVPANGVAELKAKPLWPSQSNAETPRDEWVAFVYMSPWTVQDSHWKPSFWTISSLAQPLPPMNGVAKTSLLKSLRHQINNQSKSKNYDKLYSAQLVTTLTKRLIRGTYQGRFEPKYLQNYLDEYVFRFNRRKSKSIGEKFMRIVQQVVRSTRITWEAIRWDMDTISEYFFTT